MHSARILAALALAGGTLLAGAASAADPDPAQLFDRGVADMDAGRLEQACPAIAQSYQIDPRPGTLFTLAECETKRGRLGAAAARYDEYLALYPTLSADKKAKQGDREKTARAQRAALAPRIAELTLVLPPGTRRGTQVTCDGAPIAAGTFGTPFPVDPGEHVATTQVPGGPVTSVRITLAKGERKAIALEVKESAVDEAPRAAQPPPAEPPPVAGPNKAVVAAGGALAGAGVIAGAVFTGLSFSKASSARSLVGMVPQGKSCPAGGVGATGNCADLASANDARATFANAALWTFVGAGVVGAGTVVYALLGKSPAPQSAVRAAPVVVAGGAGLFVDGVF
jgi:hypothetical protein